jgi:hypothetical protein
VEVVNQIWNTFYYLQFFKFSTDFELFKRFRVKLTEICSHRMIGTTIAIVLELKLGQEVLHGDLQALY